MPLPRIIIERPPLTPLPYGILSAAVVRDETDPHAAGGVQWQPEFCGPARRTLAACVLLTPDEAPTVTVDDQGEASFDQNRPPNIGNGVIDWGDSSPLDDSGNWTHTYDTPGDYTVTVTGDNRYTATIDITVVDSDASGPFDGSATYVPDKTDDDRSDWVESDPFTVYTISTCRLPGLTDREAYATRALQLGEGAAIEEGIADLFSSPTAGVEVMDSGDATSAVVALAKIEKRAGQLYRGIATIHMDRAVASVLLSNYCLQVKGDKLYTMLGNLVVAGASNYDYPGYPDGESTGAGESWIMATGTVVVSRNAVTTTPAVISTGGLIDNEYSVLAERSVSVGWECFLIAHKVAALDAGGADQGGVNGGTP